MSEDGSDPLNLFPDPIEPAQPASRSPSPSPTPQPRRGNSTKHAIQFIGDLPVAREDALRTFTQLESNCYQNKSIGKNTEMMESMTCECIFKSGKVLQLETLPSMSTQYSP